MKINTQTIDITTDASISECEASIVTYSTDTRAVLATTKKA